MLIEQIIELESGVRKCGVKKLIIRGGVEYTRLEAKAKDTKNPRPSTDPLDAKDRNARRQGQGPRTQAQVFSKKKVFKKKFQAFSKKKKGLQKNFSGKLQNFNHSKNSTVLEPRTGQFSRA